MLSLSLKWVNLPEICFNLKLTHIKSLRRQVKFSQSCSFLSKKWKLPEFSCVMFVSNGGWGSTICFLLFSGIAQQWKSFVSAQILKYKGRDCWSYAKVVCFLKEQGLLHQQVEHTETENCLSQYWISFKTHSSWPLTVVCDKPGKSASFLGWGDCQQIIMWCTSVGRTFSCTFRTRINLASIYQLCLL